MGSKKSGLLEKIKEGKDIGNEGLEKAKELQGDGSSIKSLLDSIDTSMDEDDVRMIQEAESGYSGDFDKAVASDVDPKITEMINIESTAISDSQSEQDKVNDARNKFDQMSGVTDVGKGNADSGAGSMETSSNEYQEFINDANSTIDDTESEADSLRNAIASIFGA